MDKLIKTNTVVTIKDRECGKYLTASRDGALVHWTQFGKYGPSEKKVQWRVQWLKGPSMVGPGIWLGVLNLWSIYNKAFAIADFSSDLIYIQTDRPPPLNEGCCDLLLTDIKNNGVDHISYDGTLSIQRIAEKRCTHIKVFPVTLNTVEISTVKSPNYDAKLYSRGASPAGLTSSSLPGWQVGQVIIGAADNTFSSPAAYFPRSYNSGGNVNYSGTQTNGDVRDADDIEY